MPVNDESSAFAVICDQSLPHCFFVLELLKTQNPVKQDNRHHKVAF